MALRFVPAHVNETTDPVDNLGGMLSVLLVAAIVLAINFAPVPGEGALALGLAAIAVAAGVAFVIRQRRAPAPLYDLDVAGRRIFWVAACAGIIVFGTLMAAMFVGQQFLQNVLGYSTLDAGLAILPAAVCMVLIAPRSAKLVDAAGLPRHPARRLRLLPARLPDDAPAVEGGHLLLEGRPRLRPHRDRRRLRRHAGLAFADRLGPGQPRRNGLGTGRPPARPGRRDHAVDPRRSAHGGLRRAAAMAIAAAPNRDKINDNVQSELKNSFSSAADTASHYPKYSGDIIAGAKSSFLQGDEWAYVAGIVAILLGAALVYFLLPETGR